MAYVVSVIEKCYPHCLVLVGYRNRFEIDGLMEEIGRLS